MSQSYPNPTDRLEEWSSMPEANRVQTDTGAIVYISDDIRKFNYHIFAAVGGTGHMHVDVTIGQGLWHEVAVTLIDDTTTNNTTKQIPANQIATLYGKFRRLRVRVSGDTTAIGSHGWV